MTAPLGRLLCALGFHKPRVVQGLVGIYRDLNCARPFCMWTKRVRP